MLSPEVNRTVPVYPVAMLPKASFAVTVTLPAVLKACGLGNPATVKLAAAAGCTLKVAVPVLPAPVTMKVLFPPTTVGVMLTPVRLPEVKLLEVPVMFAVPL